MESRGWRRAKTWGAKHQALFAKMATRYCIDTYPPYLMYVVCVSHICSTFYVCHHKPEHYNAQPTPGYEYWRVGTHTNIKNIFNNKTMNHKCHMSLFFVMLFVFRWTLLTLGDEPLSCKPLLCRIVDCWPHGSSGLRGVSHPPFHHKRSAHQMN